MGFNRMFLAIINNTLEYVEDFGKFIKIDSKVFSGMKNLMSSIAVNRLFSKGEVNEGAEVVKSLRSV